MALGLILGASVPLMKCDSADIISILSPWLGIKNSCSLASTKRIKVLRGGWGWGDWGSAKHSVSVLSAGNGEQTGDSQRGLFITHTIDWPHTHSYFSFYVQLARFHLPTLMRKCPYWWYYYHFSAICLLYHITEGWATVHKALLSSWKYVSFLRQEKGK